MDRLLLLVSLIGLDGYEKAIDCSRRGIDLALNEGDLLYYVIAHVPYHYLASYDKSIPDLFKQLCSGFAQVNSVQRSVVSDLCIESSVRVFLRLAPEALTKSDRASMMTTETDEEWLARTNSVIPAFGSIHTALRAGVYFVLNDLFEALRLAELIRIELTPGYVTLPPNCWIHSLALLHIQRDVSRRSLLRREDSAIVAIISANLHQLNVWASQIPHMSHLRALHTHIRAEQALQ